MNDFCLPTPMIAKTIEDANKMGDGTSIGYDVPSDVGAGAGGLLLVKGSAKASNSKASGSASSSIFEKITVFLDVEIDAETTDPKLLLNAWVLPENRPIERISDHAKTRTPFRAIVEFW